jgi:hypothetical protein
VTLAPVTFALLGFLLAAISALVAGGIAWGAFRAQLERQRDEIHDLRDEVRALARTVNDLTLRLAVVADRHDREHP